MGCDADGPRPDRRDCIEITVQDLTAQGIANLDEARRALYFFLRREEIHEASIESAILEEVTENKPG